MATRMTTLLYGDKPEADVEPGNRVDTEDDVAQQSPPPMRPAEETSAAARPAHATAQPFALRGLVLGLVAAAAVLAGIAIELTVFVWARSIAPGAQVALVVIGVFLFAGGAAFVVSNPTDATR